MADQIWQTQFGEYIFVKTDFDVKLVTLEFSKSRITNLKLEFKNFEIQDDG